MLSILFHDSLHKDNVNLRSWLYWHSDSFKGWYYIKHTEIRMSSLWFGKCTHTVCPMLCNVLTSISDIKFDPKVSSWAAWTVACSEDDSTNGFYLPDDAGDRWGGKDPVVSNYQTSNLKSSFSFIGVKFDLLQSVESSVVLNFTDLHCTNKNIKLSFKYFILCSILKMPNRPFASRPSPVMRGLS